MPSVLWCCWFGGRKGIRPVKNWVVGYWRGYVSGARCRRVWPSWCHYHSLSLASVKSRLVLPFWYWLTRVVPEEAQLSPRDRAMRGVSWNLANCHATVQKLLVRQVLNKSKLWSWRFSWRQCVINMCTQTWCDRVAFIVLYNNNNDRLTAFDPGQPG